MSNKSKLGDVITWVVVAAITVLAVVVLVLMVVVDRDCHAAGGVLVRGIYKNECVSRNG